MTVITTIGLDLAKSVFQVHGVDAQGKVVIAKALRRAQVLALFAMCGRRGVKWLDGSLSRLPRSRPCRVSLERHSHGELIGGGTSPAVNLQLG